MEIVTPAHSHEKQTQARSAVAELADLQSMSQLCVHLQATLAAAQVNNVLTNDQVVRIFVGRGFGHVSHIGFLGALGAALLVIATVAGNLGSVALGA